MENKRILYNFASRSRPEGFRRAVESIVKNSNSDNYRIFVKVDIDDLKLEEYYPHGPQMMFMVGKSISKVHAINRNLENAPSFDILVNMSDDMIFTAKGFDDIIRDAMTGDYLLHFPDSYARERVVTMSIMSAAYFYQFGYIYHPSYRSLFCDNEQTEVAKILGAYRFHDIPILEHLHPAAGLAPIDDQYRHTEAFWHVDKKNYNLRKALNFPL